MKVSELPYRRVTLEEVKAVMEDVLARIRGAQNAEEILEEDQIGQGLESRGTAYMDPETGKVYIVIPNGGTEENED